MKRCQDYCGGTDRHTQWRCCEPGKLYMVKHKGCGPGEKMHLCAFHKKRRRTKGQKVWLKNE